jgi:ADP-heptose:LPS heptosyltransferase
MDLALTAAEMRDAAAWWSSAGYSDGDRMRAVAIGAGSKVPSKVWPEDRFFALGRRLILEGGFLPVIFGGSEDRDVGERLVAGWGTGVVVAGRLTVRESAALMQGMCGYVGNDTGTMHLAAAAGLRCVGVFSAQDFPGRWDPYGSGHVVLRSCVPCEGCRLQMCDKGLKCLTSIDVDAVFNACDMTFRASG